MFEVLATIDPMAALLGSLWLFAAGLFPVGFMLGSTCSPCCPCVCAEGSLPETVTLTINGFTDGQTPGHWLCPIAFSSCFGSGATAHVAAPGGDEATDKGPISKVELTSGGSGYAQLGRVAPVLTISGSGTGTTFTPTLSTSQDECGRDLWAIASVAASGGTGYVDGESLTITISGGDTQVSAASAKLILDKSPPTLTMPGNATGTVSTVPLNDGTWGVAAVTVTSGGSGYTEGQSLTFDTAPNDVTVTAASATARVVHDEPQNATIDIATAGGSGAVLEPVWELLPESAWPAPHKKTYRLASVTVVSGGTGYADLEQIYISFPSAADGVVQVQAIIDTDYVGTGGVIEQVYIADPVTLAPGPAGEYVGSRTGALHSVALASGGSYYHDDPGARRVVVTAGGSYYREDASVPPYVAAVTVSIAQTPPSAGTGASLSVTIDEDTESETFGEITGVNIDAAGDDYLAFEWCEAYLNGVSVVLPRDGCTFSKQGCGRSFSVEYRGPSSPPLVAINSECNGGALTFQLEATENVANCSEMLFTAEDEDGRSATVSAGGEPTETACAGCTGSVLVNGVEVPVNTGEYVLVCVESAPTVVQTPVVVGQGVGFRFDWWRNFGVATASAECREVFHEGSFRHEIVVIVAFRVYGIVKDGSQLPPESYTPEVEAMYDQLTLGAKRFTDGDFAPYNTVFKGITTGSVWSSIGEWRGLGVVRGNGCAGPEWRRLPIQADVDMRPALYPGSPEPACWGLLFWGTRQIERDPSDSIVCSA